MKRYLLNSAVITSEGTYTYRKITEKQARLWYWDGDPPISTIGYAETAAALAALLGVPVEMARQTIVMQPGDEALIFRLVLPPDTPRLDPGDKGRISEIVTAGQWELGLLRRDA